MSRHISSQFQVSNWDVSSLVKTWPKAAFILQQINDHKTDGSRSCGNSDCMQLDSTKPVSTKKERKKERTNNNNTVVVIVELIFYNSAVFLSQNCKCISHNSAFFLNRVYNSFNFISRNFELMSHQLKWEA